MGDWRKETEKDSTKFITICEELGATPAVDVLYEWCNWLTPPGLRVDNQSDHLTAKIIFKLNPTKGILPKRFDTAFYITSIEKLPDYAAQDGGETA